MPTISFSVEDDIKKRFTLWARRAKKSKSDVFRDMVRAYEFEERMHVMQKATAPTLKKLGIETEAQLYAYLESDETYEDRVRHQRVSGSHPKK